MDQLRKLRAQADAARAAQRYGFAADLYERILELSPADADIAVQCGHMRKEAGDYDVAEKHYQTAWRIRPDQADLALQLGHFQKILNRLDQADFWYRRAHDLAPDWLDPRQELASLEKLRAIAIAADDVATLAPSLAPGASAARPPTPDRIVVRRLGIREDGPWGIRPTLRGVQAIRGFCVSSSPSVRLRIVLDGQSLHDEILQRSEAHPSHPDRHGKHTFNIWFDFSVITDGLHVLELRCVDADQKTMVEREYVVIAPRIMVADAYASDAIVEIDPADPRSPESQIRAQPSMARSARRTVFPDGVHKILVLRTDQLGDMVASIPALQRLRCLLPDACIVGLLTSANADLARTLGLFDEIIVIDFPDDWIARQRLMPLNDQLALRARLSDYSFDVAIDLASSGASRDLLRLSGARYLLGFEGGDWPWLDGKFKLSCFDPVGAVETLPHSARISALVESLGVMLGADMPVIQRGDLDIATLAPLGFVIGDQYAVLHAGARIVFARWPGFVELATRLLSATNLKIVLLTEDRELRARLPDAIAQSDRFLLIDAPLPFDQLDALLSFAKVLVGNDSGLKHLAALRGTKVVTLFSARIGWSEWGQENIGTIISRRVPCAGCAIWHDPDECGKDFACIRDIGVGEVLTETLALLA